MAADSYTRPNARELAIGAATAAAVSIAASSCVLMFGLPPAVMGFGMIMGMGIGRWQSRRMMSRRLARAALVNQPANMNVR
jgi:hypothetical protein